MAPKARVIAFYLPQFQPIPENDAWWGKGFTEWTNVGKAKPLFRGHLQPRVPADLGYYDLRLPIVREQQAELARNAGIEGFMYWHYWFGNGRRILEKTFDEVLASGKPDFPFCLGWANHSWTSKTWDVVSKKSHDSMLIEQTYPGIDDFHAHFKAVLPAFLDPRYIRVHGKPIFCIYAPKAVPNIRDMLNLWQDLAIQNGLPGIHFVGQETGWEKNIQSLLDLGFDGVNFNAQWTAECACKGKLSRVIRYKASQIFPQMRIDRFDYRDIAKHMKFSSAEHKNVYPTIVPQWDRSPRAGRRATIYTNTSAEAFQEHVESVIHQVSRKQYEDRLVFLRSWNEWGEGNYVEPDIHFGNSLLQAMQQALKTSHAIHTAE